MLVCVSMFVYVRVREEAVVLGERGVFFSTLWGLRLGEVELRGGAAWGGLFQLNSVL